MSQNPVMLYCHGLPGGAQELAIVGHDLPIIALDRFSNGDTYQARLDALADQIRQTYAGQKIHLIGFSLGAMSALELASRLADQVSHVHLISAAAPLELGNFLPDMAGKPVFETASRSKFQFAMLCAGQSIFARFAPDAFFNALFSTAAGPDKLLRDDPKFRAIISKTIATCLRQNLADYKQEVHAYVTPWAGRLETIQTNVTLWHGTADNWSPPEMALALADKLNAKTEIFDGLSHYSTLQKALPEITRQIVDIG